MIKIENLPKAERNRAINERKELKSKIREDKRLIANHELTIDILKRTVEIQVAKLTSMEKEIQFND